MATGTSRLEFDIEKLRQQNNRITPRSQALIYEVRLKEAFEISASSSTSTVSAPHKTRVETCFQILDELVPISGAFSGVLQTICQELKQSVYSKSLTSSGKEPYVEQIPYFDLVERIDDAMEAEKAKLKEHIDDLHQKLKYRDQDLQILFKKNLALKQELTDYVNLEKKLRAEISTLSEEIKKLEREKGEIKASLGKEEEELKKKLDQAQTQLLHSSHVIEKLTLFKTVYNDGSDVSRMDDSASSLKKDLIVNAEGMVAYDLYQAEKLERQFAEILDYQLEDFDSNLAQLRKKKEILEGVATEQRGAEAIRREIEALEGAFKKRMTRWLSEMQLLRQHVTSLKHEYQRTKKEHAVESIERPTDFVLRKYATVMQVSSDGQTFETFSDSKFCSKCGTRIIVCPHQALRNDIIQLPNGVTHLKFHHPTLRLKTWISYQDLSSLLKKRFETDEDAHLQETEDELEKVTPHFYKIWSEYYNTRKGFKPMINRSYQLPKLLGFIQEFYDIRWSMEQQFEENGSRADESNHTNSIGTLPRFVDYFYDLMVSRYQIQEVGLKASHDILSALEHFEYDSKQIGLFVAHLSGEQDVVWKYLYMARKLFQSRPDPLDMSKYRQVIQIMYPNRTREIYDHMELEYTAFCKNKVSRDSMEEHLIHLLSTDIEPNYLFFLKCLSRFDFNKRGYLSYEDFDDAMSQILPSVSTRERLVRYKLTELDFFPGANTAHGSAPSSASKRDTILTSTTNTGIPLERLAYIACYLVLHSCYVRNWTVSSLIGPDFIEYLSTNDANIVPSSSGISPSAEKFGNLMHTPGTTSGPGRRRTLLSTTTNAVVPNAT